MGSHTPGRTPKDGLPEDGPPPPTRTWQAPPDGLFDVIVPKLTTKQFVATQLVCKDWSRAARSCLKNAAPKRPDVDLAKLVTLYPNLTQLNLSHVEGLSTRMLTPLRQLTALRELCLSSITLQQQQEHALTEGAGAGAAPPGQGAGPAAPAAGAGGRGAPQQQQQQGSPPSQQQLPLCPPSARPRTRSRARAAAGSGAGGSGAADSLPPLPQAPPYPAPAAAHATAAAVSIHDRAGPGTSGRQHEGSVGAPDSPPRQQQQPQRQGSACTVTGAPPAADADITGGSGIGPVASAVAVAASAAAAAVPRKGGGNCNDDIGEGQLQEMGSGPGAAFRAMGPPQLLPQQPSPPISPASRIFGGLGDVLLRLNKLQADLCPALTAEAIASLPNLTDLTLDTLVAPEALKPLGRLRCLAVKKLAHAEALDRLGSLTALTSLLVNSDSSCASEFLPMCARLPELQSLTFKTSNTKVLQQPESLCWQGFSRLTHLDLRAPAECLKPGLPALSEHRGLRALSLDLYCGSDEELMVTVVAPLNLESLFVSSDRSRSGGVIDVYPNPRLRSLRIRLYWTALNLVLPDGLPEPSPMPEPLSEDLREDDDPPRPAPGGGSAGAMATGLWGAAARLAAAAAAAVAAVVPGTRTADASGGAGGCRGRGRRRTRQRSASPNPGTAGPGPAGLGRPPGAAAAAGTGDGGGGAVAGMSGGDAEEQADADSGRDRQPAATATAAAAPGSPRSGSGQRQRRTLARRSGLGCDRSGGGGGDMDTDADGGGAAAGPSSGGGAASAGTVGTPFSARHGGGGSPLRSTAADTAADDGAGGGPATPVVSAGGVGAMDGGGVSGGCGGGGGAGVGGIPVPEMELTELCLDACFFLLYGSLVPVLRQFPRLKSLTLDNCLALENGELSQLCELGGLREVSLSGVHLVTDAGLRALGRLSALTSLRLKGLRKLSVHAAQAYMRQKPIVRRYEEISGSFLTSLSGLRDLRCLALKHLHTAGEAQLAAGLAALPQLTRLEVKDVHSMSDAVLLQSVTRLTQLQELAVLHCEAVTKRGRNFVVRALGQRVAVDFEGCNLPDITRPCALPTTSTQAQLIDDDQVSSNHQRRSCQHSNQH